MHVIMHEVKVAVVEADMNTILYVFCEPQVHGEACFPLIQVHAIACCLCVGHKA